MPQSKHKQLYHHHLPFGHKELVWIFNKASLYFYNEGLSSTSKEMREQEQAMMTKVAQYLKENT